MKREIKTYEWTCDFCGRVATIIGDIPPFDWECDVDQAKCVWCIRGHDPNDPLPAASPTPMPTRRFLHDPRQPNKL
jgi:hypothetical protein